MLARIVKHLRAQWAGVLALFLVLTGGVAYAANTVFSSDIVDGEVKAADIAQGAVATSEIGTDQVQSVDVRNDTLSGGGLTAADLRNGSVGNTEIADGGVRSADVQNEALTGADIAESTLQNVNAGKVGGVQVRKINFQVPIGTGPTTVLDLAGLQITAECQNFGDGLDVKAFTSKNGASVLYFAGFATLANDTDGSQDIDSASSTDGTFNIDDQLQIDNATPEDGTSSIGTLHYAAPDGSVVVAHLAIDEVHSGSGQPHTGCTLTGTAIGG